MFHGENKFYLQINIWVLGVWFDVFFPVRTDFYLRVFTKSSYFIYENLDLPEVKINFQTLHFEYPSPATEVHRWSIVKFVLIRN